MKSGTFWQQLVWGIGLAQLILLGSCRTGAGDSGLKEDDPVIKECEAASDRMSMDLLAKRALCAESDPNMAPCIIAARDKMEIDPKAKLKASSPLSTGDTRNLCASANSGSAACIKAARQTGLSSSDTLKLCKSSNDFTGPCISSARETLVMAKDQRKAPGDPLSSTDTVQLCGAADLNSEAANCIASARQAGLSSASTYTSCKENNPESGKCLAAAQEALVKLPGDTVSPSGPIGSFTVTNLCAAAKPGAPECVTAARRAALGDANTYTLCAKADLGAAACIQAASRNMAAEKGATATVPTAALNSFGILALCSMTTIDTGPCIDAARLAGFGQSALASLCKSPTSDTAACVAAARPATVKSTGLGSNQFLNDLSTGTLCSYPAVETAECIKKARKEGKTSSQIVNACRPPPRPEPEAQPIP